MSIQYDVKGLALADEGRDAIEWADRQMPVLSLFLRSLSSRLLHLPILSKNDFL